MSRKAKAFVLDSWSIMAYLEGEPAGTRVADLIADAREAGHPLVMSVVNAAEIWYLIARQTSLDDADESLSQLEHLGIGLVSADWPIARAAAGLKARHKMSLADCFAAALARHMKAELVTGDPEFRQVDGEVKVHWL